MTLKNIIIFFSFFIMVQSSSIDNTQQPMSKKNVIILWDIHGVILKTDFSKAISIFRHENDFKNIIRNMSRRLLVDFFKLTYRSITTQKTFADDFIHAAYQYNNIPLAHLIIKVSNAQKPITETVAIIEELHALGYRNHIGSNIAATTFHELIDQEKHPQFSYIFNNFELDKSQVVHYALPEIKKPNVEFFNFYFIKNNINPKNTTVIFIDDKKRNVLASYKAGCIGILFESPQQLRSALCNLGIPLKENNSSLPAPSYSVT